MNIKSVLVLGAGLFIAAYNKGYIPESAQGKVNKTLGTVAETVESVVHIKPAIDPYESLLNVQYPPVAKAGTYGTKTCRNHEGLLGGEEPKVSEFVGKNGKYWVFCNSQFVNGVSGITRTGLWSAWRLTAQEIEAAHGMEREDSFRADERLGAGVRAELSDYQQSGFDRGHIFPNADARNKKAQRESFVLSNIFPQAPKHNRGVWSELEQRTRKMALKYGEVYVVTGVAFRASEPAVLRGRVYVPSHVFKAVYIPAKNEASACLSVNTPKGRCHFMTINQLKEATGVDAFPALSGVPKNVSFRW